MPKPKSKGNQADTKHSLVHDEGRSLTPDERCYRVANAAHADESRVDVEPDDAQLPRGCSVGASVSASGEMPRLRISAKARSRASGTYWSRPEATAR